MAHIVPRLSDGSLLSLPGGLVINLRQVVSIQPRIARDRPDDRSRLGLDMTAGPEIVLSLEQSAALQAWLDQPPPTFG